MKAFRNILLITLLLGLSQNISAQMMSSYLYGQATIGENPTLFVGNMVIGNTGQLFLGSHQPSLQKTHRFFHVGDYEGKTGARLHLSVTDNSNTHGSRGFFDIVGTATGTTEIILDMFSGWDGTIIDVARAHDADSDPDAFVMQENFYNGRLAQLRSRIEGNDRVWFIGVKDDCLPIIMQKQNNTLTVDNNPTTNGGYTFSYFKWFRNDELVHEGAWGTGLGGIFNVGRGRTLSPYDSYHVLLIDQYGNEHMACPFNPTIFIPHTEIKAYPNPTNIYNSLVVVDVETNEENLLENGIIHAFNILGQPISQTRTNGHRITPIQLPSVAGTYLLRFVSGDFEKVIRVIIQ